MIRLLAGLSLLAVGCLAQTVTGNISGTVLDPSGLAISGATVTLQNEETGETRELISSDSGDFVFTAVSPGPYTVVFRFQGMKRFEKRNLNLTAAERLSVGDIRMEIGAVTESVNVSAQGAVVQTTSQERSAVLDSKQMAQLMTKSRDFIALLRVLPGVVYGSENDVIGPSTGPTIQGVRNTMNTY